MREWRPVVGYEKLYLVSSDGLIYSKITNKLRKEVPCPNGYLYVVLSAVIARDPNTGQEYRYDCAREAEKHYRTNYRNISAVCRGKRKHAGGMEWRFA